MSKEDTIYIYTVGVRNKHEVYTGIAAYHHKLSFAVDLVREISTNWDSGWQDVGEIFIRREQENIVKYMNDNCDNISIEEAEELAKEHGFTIKEINWHPSFGE